MNLLMFCPLPIPEQSLIAQASGQVLVADPTVVSGGATSSKDKKTWKVKVAKQFKKMGGQSGGGGGNDKGNTSGAAPYPEGGSIGVPASEHSQPPMKERHLY